MVNAILVRNLPVLNFAYLLPKLGTHCVNGKRPEISITPHGKTKTVLASRFNALAWIPVSADSTLLVELGLRVLTVTRIPDSKAPDFGIRIPFT